VNVMEVTVVRIYLTEKEHLLEALVRDLHDREKVKGVTVFRGIAGFGKSGALHTSKLLDVSFDLPLVVEFFDEPQRVREILEHLSDTIEPVHIISWPASTNVG
jgi:PII-like signaling protein